MFDSIGRAISMMVFVAVIFGPLGIWKACELVLSVASHLHWH